MDDHDDNDIELKESLSVDVCKICHSSSEKDELVSPCACVGTLQFCHKGCLRMWILSQNSTRCEICGSDYTFKKRFKKLKMWRAPPLTESEMVHFLFFIAAVLMLTLSVPIIYWCLMSSSEEGRTPRRTLGLVTFYSFCYFFQFVSTVVIFNAFDKCLIPLFHKWLAINKITVILVQKYRDASKMDEIVLN